MKASFFASALTLLSAAVAAPLAAPELEDRSASNLCLTMKEAETIVTRYISTLTQEDSDLGDYLTTASEIVTENYQETSDSVLSLMGSTPVSASF